MLEPIQRTEDMKIGRRKVAQILHHKNGLKIMVVNRTLKDIIRGRDNKMISHAMEADEACWSVETLLLSRMKHRGVDIIAIRVRETKTLYASRLSSWLTDSTVYTRRKRNGSIQRILPFSYFMKQDGVVKI